uniref:Uncharacterized protein n=1 Tax=Manihot esculenta TaxID=3983 RepID=A0A2C9UJT2_MANES
MEGITRTWKSSSDYSWANLTAPAGIRWTYKCVSNTW